MVIPAHIYTQWNIPYSSTPMNLKELDAVKINIDLHSQDLVYVLMEHRIQRMLEKGLNL